MDNHLVNPKIKARKRALFELPCSIVSMGQIIFTKLIIYCTHGTYIRWSFGIHAPGERKRHGFYIRWLLISLCAHME